MNTDILKPIANLPLISPRRGVAYEKIKGCHFTPALYLDPDKLYLMYYSREAGVTLPPRGFYEIPEKGGLAVYIKSFTPYMRSENRKITMQEELTMDADKLRDLHQWVVYVFIANQGDPPKDWVPDKNFDYSRAQAQQIQEEGKLINVH